MIQTFQCPVCGNPVEVGEPTCKACGETFSYNCPACGFIVDNRFHYCPNCGIELNWVTHPQTGPSPAIAYAEAGQHQEQDDEKPQKLSQPKETTPVNRRGRMPGLWLILVFVCILLIIIVLVIDRILNAKV